MESKRTVSDSYVYQYLEFRVGTLSFYLGAFRYYKSLLEEEVKILEESDFLSLLLGEKELTLSPLTKELAWIERHIQIFQKKIDNSDWISPSGEPADFEFRELNLTHRSIRYTKSVVNLYWRYLKTERDAFVRSHRPSRVTLQTIDAEMTRLAESSKGGVFENAQPIPLLVDFPEPEESYHKKTVAQEVPTGPEGVSLPVPIYGLEILDSELHERCGDLLGQFSEAPDSPRFDTIISEATRVLENRIRSLPGIDPNTKDPVGAAFGGSDPVIKLSDHKTEREGALLLFKGIFQFIRNPFHHKIIPIDRERVIQLLGMVDYLLYLIDNASRSGDSRRTVKS